VWVPVIAGSLQRKSCKYPASRGTAVFIHFPSIARVYLYKYCSTVGAGYPCMCLDARVARRAYGHLVFWSACANKILSDPEDCSIYTFPEHCSSAAIFSAAVLLFVTEERIPSSLRLRRTQRGGRRHSHRLSLWSSHPSSALRLSLVLWQI
jgi:hypothetical protein